MVTLIRIVSFKCIHMGQPFRAYLYVVKDEAGKHYEIALNLPSREVYVLSKLENAISILKQFDHCDEEVDEA